MADTFRTLIRPVVERIIASIHESRALAALRDTLLPKLISGELRVKDAEKFVEKKVLGTALSSMSLRNNPRLSLR
ncbi:MAG: type I restriction endonuclease subunit S [Candidatus Tectomicrobia bacterium]|nr:type I restriction endonuclease subunit S [Candidatus Tectomicrobia bacterium]